MHGMQHAVYRITCKVNGKSYIGATGDVVKRWREHKRKALAGEKTFLIYEAMRSYGVSNFTIETLSLHADKRTAFNAEIAAINFYGTIEPYGYNMRVMGRALTEEHADKIRTALRKEEVRQTISDKLIAISNTPEMLEKRRLAGRGRTHTPEAREAIGASKRGVPQSAEHIAALSAVRKGKIHSKESKLKVAKLTEIDVQMIKICLKAGDSAADIAAGFGVSSSTISKIATGKSWQWVTV